MFGFLFTYRGESFLMQLYQQQTFGHVINLAASVPNRLLKSAIVKLNNTVELLLGLWAGRTQHQIC